MKVLYFDCFSGISGDMTLGALLDLGIDENVFKSELAKLNLSGYDIIIEKKTKSGIIGTDVQVIIYEENEKAGGGTCEHTHHHHPHRTLENIETIIDCSDLKQNVKDLSKKVFREIARAEAKVHNKGINEVHFHEVGAVDSIVDVVGTAICMDLLNVKKVFSSPLHDGRGFIESEHGILPVPVPAVMEILKDGKIPLVCEDVNTELVTPTGAGIIKCLVSDFGNMPAMIVDKIGYGFGKRDAGRLNALRVVVGTLFGEENMIEEIAVLETNIDDMAPELLGFVCEKLFQAGALDVFFTPVYMKKNRPAIMLTVLAGKGQEKRLVDIILKETTSLGVRRIPSTRYCLNRETVKVATEVGEARVKVASKGDFYKISPEYEDCREIALKTGMPIMNVYELVKDSFSKAAEWRL